MHKQLYAFSRYNELNMYFKITILKYIFIIVGGKPLFTNPLTYTKYIMIVVYNLNHPKELSVLKTIIVSRQRVYSLFRHTYVGKHGQTSNQIIIFKHLKTSII